MSISVIDKPDLDPQFVREFYSASVAEDTPQVCWAPGGGAGGSPEVGKGLATDRASPQGTSVLKVEAMDGDRGINDPVIYSISSENGVSPGWGWGKGRGGGSSEPLEGATPAASSQIPQGLAGLTLASKMG